jgi:hypothetical protein
MSAQNACAAKSGCCAAAEGSVQDPVFGDAGHDGGGPALEFDGDISAANGDPDQRLFPIPSSIASVPGTSSAASSVESTSPGAICEGYRGDDLLPDVSDSIAVPEMA